MRNNDTPSMDNIYNSKFYTETKNYEQNLSDDFYKKAQMPFQTGVVPHYLNADDTTFNNTDVIKSISGNDINIKDFKHGNMQPFLRKGITQNTEQFGLNKNMGYSTDINFKKQEVPKEAFFNPFIKNENNIDNNTFLISRTNLSKIQNNINPIESIRVGPGLNKGYTSEPGGGFQQADTMNYIKPKNIDELRPISNQKSSIYTLPMKPKNNIEQRPMIVPLNKNKTEKFTSYTSDNWFKGQSVLKKEAERPQENIKDTSSKTDSHIDYYGPIKYQNEYFSKNDDYGKSKIIVYDNERNLTQKETRVANLSSVIKAMINPITDALKITLKEYLIDNPRLNGNAVPQAPKKATLYDPINHIMKTTIKETTIHEGNGGVLSGMDETYSALYDTTKTTTKETTIHEGNGGVLSGMDETYSALYDTAKTTTKETTIHEGNGGFMKEKNIGYVNNHKLNTTLKETLPSQDTTRNINNVSYYSTYVYDPKIVAKTTVRETTIYSDNSYGFIGGLLNSLLGGYLIKEDKAKNTQRQFSLTENYGIATSKTVFTPTDRDANYNAHFNDNREQVMIKTGYIPNGGGKYTGLPKDEVNMVLNKKHPEMEESERIGTLGLVYEGMPLRLEQNQMTKPNNKCLNSTDRLDNIVLSTLIDNDLKIKINPI